jgi:hypothetical protein
MFGYRPFEKLLSGRMQTLGASVTKQVVSEEFAITSGGALHLRVDIAAQSVTPGAGITFGLQHTSGNNSVAVETWFDTKTVAITADGVFSMTFLVEVAGDQAYLPLCPKGRIVVSTGAGSVVNITSVRIVQEI